jgi:hypothetical protein
MTAYKRSVGANTQSVHSKIYATDMNTAWQAVLDSLKSVRLDVTNREAGFLQTRWVDNTKEKNFTDGDGSTAPYMKAQYRIKASVAKGVYQGVKAVKVTIQREQVAQRDALDDFRPLESDSIEEKTLLYRVGRIIALRTRLARLEERRTKLEMEQAASGDPALGGNPADPNVPPPIPEDAASSELPPAPESEALAPSG